MFNVSLTNQLCLLDPNSQQPLPLKPTTGPYVYGCHTITALTPQGTRLYNINLVKINSNLILEVVLENQLIGRIVFLSNYIFNNLSDPYDMVGLRKDLNLIYDCWFEHRSPIARAREEEEDRVDAAQTKKLLRQSEKLQRESEKLQRKSEKLQRECDETERIFEENHRAFINFHEKVTRLATTATVRILATVFFFFSSAATSSRYNFRNPSHKDFWKGFKTLPYPKWYPKNGWSLNNKNCFPLLEKSSPSLFSNSNYLYKPFAYPYSSSQVFFPTRKYPATPEVN